MKKKQPNKIIGLYLIEHDPEDEKTPYSVWDMRVMFSNDHGSFTFASMKEAEAAITRLSGITAPK